MASRQIELAPSRCLIARNIQYATNRMRIKAEHPCSTEI